jgi:hypothetical protein
VSAGPIRRERDAWKPPIVSIADNARVCARSEARGYCGRRSAVLSSVWAKVTCPDCKAAFRADGGKVA